MKVLILAAGRGERLRPLTDQIPKPLIQVGPCTLIEHHLRRLQRSGYTEVVINLAHLGAQIRAALGNGERYGLRIQYSDEGAVPLGTGGALKRALPLLGERPFLLLNADLLCDADLRTLPEQPAGLAHLLMVPNPPHNPHGDFAFDGLRLQSQGTPCLTYAGIGVYRPELVADQLATSFSLVPLLRAAMDAQQVSAQVHDGLWMDVGTPQRLAAARALMASAPS